jgi:hypothetical protein
VNDAVTNPPAVAAAAPGPPLPLDVRADGEMTRTGIAFAFVLGTIACSSLLPWKFSASR